MSFLKKVVPVSWHYAFSNIKRKVFGYTQFAQFGEDAVLAELFRDTSHGIYVDVGAHHPYRYSNTYLLHQKGWHGTNIDPNPHSIRLFHNARPQDKNICRGVGNAGTLVYYQFSDPAVNTFKEEEAHKWMGKPFLKFLGTVEVNIQPLSELVEGPLDLLSVDAEGMDLEVLESYDWRHSPKVIVVEGSSSKEFLSQKGYLLHIQCGPSYIYQKVTR